MVRLIDDKGSRLLETAHRLLGHPDFSAALAAEIRRPGGAERAVQALLKEFHLNPFPVWKTIQVGGMDKDALIAELERKGFWISDGVRDMMNQEGFVTSAGVVEVSLVRVKVANLGFKGDTLWKAICDRAESLGLKRCRAEIGPYVRLADADQSIYEGYWIGMEPIIGSDCKPWVFGVDRHVGCGMLLNYDALPDAHWLRQHEVVFEVAGK